MRVALVIFISSPGQKNDIQVHSVLQYGVLSLPPFAHATQVNSSRKHLKTHSFDSVLNNLQQLTQRLRVTYG